MSSALLYLAVVSGMGACALLGVCVYWYAYLPVHTLRSTRRVCLLGMRDGETVEVGLQAAGVVRIERLPGFALLLLLLHEDDLFFTHRGINFREVMHRIRAYSSGQGPLAGGSSISQQLAKHLFSAKRKRRRFGRWAEKLQELMYALRMERAFSKEELATLYINSVRFGPDPVVGISAASRIYFNRSPEECAPHEFLFLFGLIPAPTTQIARIIRDHDYKLFPTKTAFVKCVDLLRLVSLTFGWGMLDRLKELSFRDVVAVAREMKYYTPYGLSPEFELALEVRAIEEIAKLEQLIVALVREPTEEFAQACSRWLEP